jgi:hypothetical protein
LLGEFLDGVAEGGARHVVGVLAEEFSQQVFANALAHLAEHPAYGFMHKVVGVMQMDLGIAQAP